MVKSHPFLPETRNLCDACGWAMHIPDGYLSPSTCAALYAGSAPFWYTALRRVERVVQSRMMPLLSVFAAFSFIVMMFNLPLPGGTTGHAVGVAVASIVLGPWASILAISIALTIQAIFFGDGGITALGANCFNMAIMGSLAAWGIYRAAAGHAPIQSRRRVVAAAVAGYCSINLAALLAAIEFGIQPLLFHNAAGAPLYAPYPLRIAIPAMMIGHLTIAGMAELVLSAGVVAYLQRAEPTLLAATAPGATAEVEWKAGAWSATRPLWTALAVLMILTPLGILAAGSAWGEWSPDELVNRESRQRIAAASGNLAPPAVPPEGLRRMASFWTAPMPRYAPPFLRSAALGYALSAMAGSGVIILVFLAAGRIFRGPPG
jgi:cobalt/nickel transport system permease protein